MLPKTCKFTGVFVSSCLTKEYPQQGEFAGGIIFRRCYGQGDGIGFTKQECESMWGDFKLKDHMMLVHNDIESATAPSTVETTAPASNTAPRTVETTVPASTTAPSTADIKPGDSVEVWWDGDEQWYAEVITDKLSDTNNKTAWECR